MMTWGDDDACRMRKFCSQRLVGRPRALAQSCVETARNAFGARASDNQRVSATARPRKHRLAASSKHRLAASSARGRSRSRPCIARWAN